MTQPVTVALLGFSPFERASIEAHFRARRGAERAYLVAEEGERPDFTLADGHDDALYGRLVQSGCLAHTVCVGGPWRAGLAAQLPRPIRMKQLQQALDTLPLPEPAPDQPQPSLQVQRVLAELAARTSAHGTCGEDFNVAEEITQEHVLVVDDDDRALRFMVAALERYGFDLHLVRSVTDALARCRRRAFDFIFVEEGLAAVAGLAEAMHAACRDAQRRHGASAGRRAPTLVVLGSPASGSGALPAGFDARLAPPLRRQGLLRVIGLREEREFVFADTAGAATMY